MLLEHFSENPDDNPIHPQKFIDFTEEWSKLDPHASHRIYATQLPVLLRRAPPPLGLGPELYSVHALLVVLRAFDDGPARLPVRREGSLVFHELLMSLTRRSFSMPPDGLGASRFAILHREKVRSAIRQQTPMRYRSRGSAAELNLSVLDIWAAQQLQCRWQGFKVRRAAMRAKTGIDLGAQAREEIRETRARTRERLREERRREEEGEEGRGEEAEAEGAGLGAGDGARRAEDTGAPVQQMAVGRACAAGGSSAACGQEDDASASATTSPKGRRRAKKKKNYVTGGPMRAAATEPMAPAHGAAAEPGASGWPNATGTEPAVDLMLDC